jgi:hypothetical protein
MPLHPSQVSSPSPVILANRLFGFSGRRGLVAHAPREHYEWIDSDWVGKAQLVAGCANTVSGANRGHLVHRRNPAKYHACSVWSEVRNVLTSTPFVWYCIDNEKSACSHT